jgi:hypothetical protein
MAKPILLSAAKPSRKEFIAKIVRRRIAQSELLTVRAIHAESGGSFSTIQKVIDEALQEIPDLVTGNLAYSTPERMRDMQKRIDELGEKNVGLKAEAAALRESLTLFRDDMQALIGQLVFTNKEVAKGLDDVRQAVIRIQPQTRATSNEVMLGQIELKDARLAQATKSLFDASRENEKLRARLVELGEDF